MTTWGFGFIPYFTEENFVPGYRWDHEENPYYYLRPDRLIPNVASAIKFTTYPGYLEYQAGLHSQLAGKHSRGGGGPSALTQPPPSSSRSRVRTKRTRRKSCPKGHYWSYKKKKCVKSKFR